MFKIMEVCTGKGCYPGTLRTIQNLEKLGCISIVETKYYHENEHYDDTEGLEWYDEDFEIVYETCDGDPINNNSGYDFVGMMIRGLAGVEINYEKRLV